MPKLHKQLTTGRIALFAVLALLVQATVVSAGEIPRTPSGKPDLSGNYDISTITPYTRPAHYGDRMTLTDEESAKLEAQRAQRTEALAADSDPDREPPPKGANVGAYNDFWMDWGTTNFKLDGKYRTSVIIDPPNGQMPTPTEIMADNWQNGPQFDYGRNDGTAWWMGETRKPYDDPEFNIPGIRCIYQDATTIPMRSLPYNNMYTILQTDTHVMIQTEWMHYTRVVRMNAEHPPEDVVSLGGDSIGWWEGDTLMIETTNFRPMLGLPQAGRRVVESFTPIDANTLRYKFTVEDPRYEAPYTGESVFPRTDNLMYEYACHEGNYAMASTLRGARVLEADWEKKQTGSGSD